MIGRFICWLRGHKRGKRINYAQGMITFQCPRCKATWTRKGKAGAGNNV